MPAPLRMLVTCAFPLLRVAEPSEVVFSPSVSLKLTVPVGVELVCAVSVIVAVTVACWPLLSVVGVTLTAVAVVSPAVPVAVPVRWMD